MEQLLTKQPGTFSLGEKLALAGSFAAKDWHAFMPGYAQKLGQTIRKKDAFGALVVISTVVYKVTLSPVIQAWEAARPADPARKPACTHSCSGLVVDTILNTKGTPDRRLRVATTAMNLKCTGHRLDTENSDTDLNILYLEVARRKPLPETVEPRNYLAEFFSRSNMRRFLHI